MQVKDELEKLSEHCFVTLENRVSLRLFDTKEFVKSASKKDEFALQVIKDHVVITNANKWAEILSKISA